MGVCRYLPLDSLSDQQSSSYWNPSSLIAILACCAKIHLHALSTQLRFRGIAPKIRRLDYDKIEDKTQMFHQCRVRY